jgi:hypothetical protein
MNINKYLIDILSLLSYLDNKNIDQFLSIKNDTVTVKIDNNSFIKIDEETSYLIDKEDILSKIIPVKFKSDAHSVEDGFKKFISVIKDNIIRLNHIGISYSCKKIEDELVLYKNLIKDKNLKIYEEESGFPK